MKYFIKEIEGRMSLLEMQYKSPCDEMKFIFSPKSGSTYHAHMSIFKPQFTNGIPNRKIIIFKDSVGKYAI